MAEKGGGASPGGHACRFMKQRNMELHTNFQHHGPQEDYGIDVATDRDCEQVPVVRGKWFQSNG